jgi:hypothetical protein
MRRAAIILVIVLAGALSGTASGAASFKFFQTPSKRIHCAWFSSPSNLRCDIDGGLHPRPPRPPSCNLEYGDSFEMARTGKAHLTCHGDTTKDPRAKVLAYRTTWSRGGFTCASRTTGLTCRNASGHGFFLSREAWRKF